MSEPVRIGWTEWKTDVQYSTSPPEVFKRFRIFRSSVYGGRGELQIVDGKTQELGQNLYSLAAARAWAIARWRGEVPTPPITKLVRKPTKERYQWQ